MRISPFRADLFYHIQNESLECLTAACLAAGKVAESLECFAESLESKTNHCKVTDICLKQAGKAFQRLFDKKLLYRTE